MDFVQEIIDYEEREDGIVAQFVLVPNPERYEKVENEDFNGYYDRLDEVYIPISTLENAASQMDGLPIYYAPPGIKSISEYVEERREPIEAFFEGDSESPELGDASQELLQNLAEENDTRFIILSIDLVGSTHLSQELETKEYRKVIQIFFREISMLIEQFRGHVLDYQGDRIISYFPDPNYTGMHDNAIDCATCMVKLINDGLNPILQSNNIPELRFRIGMDSGEADIASVGAPGIRGELSLFGDTINISSKIEEQAGENEILLGEETERNLHTRWRQNTELLDLDNWDFEAVDGDVYQIFRYNY